MINLLPFDARETIDYAGKIHALNRFSFLILSTAIGAAFVMGTAIFLLRDQSAALTASVNSQEQAIRELEPILRRADDVEGKITIASNILESEVRFSELLVELGAVLPAGTTIEGISLGEDLSTPLTITVIADQYYDTLASVIRENIVGSDIFVEADIQDVNIGSTSAEGGARSTVTVVALLKNDSPAKATTVEQNSIDSVDGAEEVPDEL